MIEELLNISLELREKFRKESTPRHVLIKEMENGKAAEVKFQAEL
jgi:hypothetical protein